MRFVLQPKEVHMKSISWMSLCLAVCACSISGCLSEHRDGVGGISQLMPVMAPKIPAGTSIRMRLGSTISSESAHTGDTWLAFTLQDVRHEGSILIPSGSAVEGIVTGVTPSRKGAYASIDLTAITISANGRIAPIKADVQALVSDPSDPARTAKGPVPVIGAEARTDARARLGAAPHGIAAASASRRLVLTEGMILDFRVRQAPVVKGIVSTTNP